jgi:N-acetylmuramoyl-L-alanine amidase
MRSILIGTLLFAGSVFLTGCANRQGVGYFHTVVVDAGHGGIDKGARGSDGSVEKTYTLDTAKRLERALRSRGYRVIMTRKNDTFIPLPTRAAISNRERGAIFVSVHYNWASRSSAEGSETYYFNAKSYPLAANIQRELARVATPSRGVKRARFHVLRNNTRPAALVEFGFVSCSSELRDIKSAGYRQRMVDAVVRGIIKSGN